MLRSTLNLLWYLISATYSAAWLVVLGMCYIFVFALPFLLIGGVGYLAYELLV